MPTGLRKLLLDKALTQDKEASNIKDVFGQKDNSVAPIALSSDRMSESIRNSKLKKEEQDKKIEFGPLTSEQKQDKGQMAISELKKVIQTQAANKKNENTRTEEELLKTNLVEKIKRAYPSFTESEVNKYVNSYLPEEKIKYNDFLNQEIGKVKKEIDPYALTRAANVQNQLSEIEAQRKGINENIGLFRVGPKETTNVGAYSIPDTKFDYSQIYSIVNGKPQFNDKFISEVARQRVLSNYQIPASQIAKDLIEGKVNNYKYDFTAAQKKYNNFIDEAAKSNVLGPSAIYVDQLARKALSAFHTLARYTEGLAGEAGITIDGMPKSIMDAAEYSRKDKQKENQIYNSKVQKSLAAQLGGTIGSQIPMILGTIATGGGAALAESELAAATASLGGLGSAAEGAVLRAGLADSGIAKFGLDASANVLRGLNAGLKGAQKVGLGGVADNFITTFPTFFPTVHSSYYEELYNKGYRGEELETKAWQRALISMATETIYNPFHNLGSIGKNNIVESVLNASKKSWPETILKLGKAAVKSGVPEGFEEVVNKVADDWQDYNDYTSLYGKDKAEFNLGKSLLNSGNDFKIGSLAGIIMGGPTEALNLIHRPMQADALDFALTNKQDYSKAIERSLAENKITPEVAKTLKSFTDTLSPYYEKAKNKGLTGPTAAQYAIESARLNEAVSKLQNPATTPIESKYLINVIGKANNSMKALENGVFTGNALVGAEEIGRMVEAQTPYGRLTGEQTDAIASNGLYEVKSIPIVSNPNTIAPKNEDGTFDNTIPFLAQQMRNKEVEIDNPNGLLPILDKNGRVIDGKKRIAAALALGQTEMDVMVPVAPDKVNSIVADALNTSLSTTLDPKKISDLSSEDQMIVKSISKEFDNYRELERAKAEEQGDFESNLKGSAFPIENVAQQLKPMYWAINQLVSNGIAPEKIPSIVSAMTGSAVTPAMVDAVIKSQNITPAERPITSTVAPTVPGVAPAEVATATSVADQIRNLTAQLDEGGLSKSEAREVKKQITDLKRSDKISNFTKIVNELERKGIAQRLDKNCP
jgi:hypothetical protein